MSRFKTALVLLFTMTLVTSAAYAQTDALNDQTTFVKWTPIINAVINTLFPLVAMVATYLINDKIKNQQLAQQLSNAIQNGLGIAQQSLSTTVQAANLTTTVQNPGIAKGVQYVLDNAAEAISRFKIPPERIAQKIEAKLGLAEIATNLATTMSPDPMVKPLAPL